MPNFSSEINKEFYKMQLEAIGKNIIDRADDILEDWDKGIREINLKANEPVFVCFNEKYSTKAVLYALQKKNIKVQI